MQIVKTRVSMSGVMRCRRGITFYCTENGDPRKLVYVPVGFVKRFISISLSDLENIGELLGDTVFDCCTRSPEFGPISKLPQLANS